MTPAEEHPAARGQASRLAGLFAFGLTLVVGGAGGAILLAGFKANVEQTARRDVTVIGASVARALAQDFEKAARFGIPLKLLPGVESYLSQTLDQTPGIARIVLRGPDGREVRSAIGRATGTDTTSAPILVDGLTVGQVDVTTSPAAFSTVFGDMGLRLAAAVLVCAAAAGVIAGRLAGGALERRRRRLVLAMAHNLAGELDSGPAAAALGHGPVGRAFAAVSRGTRRLGEKWAALQSYAEELLAVDFDGRLRPEIERIRREAMPRAGTAPQAAPGQVAPGHSASSERGA